MAASRLGRNEQMDQEARRRLLEKAISIIEEGNRLCAVPMNEFFEGNTDERSIGVNLPPEKHIGLNGFRRVLEEIRERPDVQEVFIELTEVPYPDDEEDADMWPVGCVAFVITSAPKDQVAKWVQPLHPRDVCEGWNVRVGVKTPLADGELTEGMRPVRVWLL
jgi:hypothetical protein